MGRDRSGTDAAQTEKVCGSCGRRITWRRAWADTWDEVRWCSDACRRRRVRPVDRDLERATLHLLDRRAAGATTCPSEAARLVHTRTGAGGDGEQGWRELLEAARAAARRLVAAGEVELTQRGQVVDPSSAKGPVRVRRVR